VPKEDGGGVILIVGGGPSLSEGLVLALGKKKKADNLCKRGRRWDRTSTRAKRRYWGGKRQCREKTSSSRPS